MNEKSLMNAIAALREHTGMSQTRFAVEVFGKTLSTQQRYEGVRPPPPVELAKLVHIARQNGRVDLAEIFKRAAIETVPDAIRELIREPENAQSRPDGEKTASKGNVDRRKVGSG